MDVLQLARELMVVADLVVVDRDGHSLLFVGVTTAPQHRDQAAEILQARFVRFGFDYGMLVDPELVSIFARDQPDCIAQFSSAEVIQPYNPNFAATRKWIFPDYLRGMIESWLADFASSWRYQEPPHADIMGKVGLRGRLVGSRIDVGGEIPAR